ncbi:MAG TPA: thioredoxin domain-containing protein [Acidobacteriota bacterium]|nr:thioredoxin domain-containing protein [Acidobacteriota bacterium]
MLKPAIPVPDSVMTSGRNTNALINETSPYLLQHAHNPVDWYPWGEEALARAKKEDKPILLSIGYSACHWCHVMERESFEDEEIAALMNGHFINIKVDREERPDLDAIYMAAVQMMTGSGGWPMTLFLTPEQAPFFCGTYFPKDDRHGMPGFRRVLKGIAEAYRQQKEAVYKDARFLSGELRKTGGPLKDRGALHLGLLETAASSLASGYDSVNGGFGQAPKFPPSMTLTFLMRFYLRSRDEAYREIVEKTLTKMARGGMYDQLGGGFHRYSVDARWLVPHFEKMLYDNALLSRAYLDAYLLTGNDSYRRICREVLDYVNREMTSPEGGFYSSQDADSEGEEGTFFLWTVDEIKSLLGAENARVFCRHYGVAAEGNFAGKNILHIPDSGDPASGKDAGAPENLPPAVRRGRETLLEARNLRPKPGRDEKILTAWNGLMMRSFAEASVALMDDEYRRIAVRNAEFLLLKLRRNGSLLRSYKDGQARFNAYLEDYAYLIDGLVSLYEADFAARWVDEANGLAASMIARFWDERDGGFFFTAVDHEDLIHRPKEYYDGATPSGNSAAAAALLRLWKLTGDDRWVRPAVTILEGMAEAMTRHPHSFSHMLCALDYYLGPVKEIAIIGAPDDSDARALLREVFGRYLPNKAVACGQSGGLPMLENRSKPDGHAAAYVCENFTCLQPAASPENLRKLLGKSE